MDTHCACGYEFSDGMRFCPYCGKKRKGFPRHNKHQWGIIAHDIHGREYARCELCRKITDESPKITKPNIITKKEYLRRFEEHMITEE